MLQKEKQIQEIKQVLLKADHKLEVDENFFQYLSKHGKFELVK